MLPKHNLFANEVIKIVSDFLTSNLANSFTYRPETRTEKNITKTLSTTLTLKELVTTIDAPWEGMGDAG